MRGIQPGHHGLFDLGAGEAIAGRRQGRQREVVGIELAPAQVQAQQLDPGVGIGQVDEEDLVEAALAQQLGRQLVDLVGGGHDEHRALALGQPGQQVAQDAPRHPAILATAGQALLDLVDPQHARGQLLGRGQRLAQVLLGLAVVLVIQAAKVQPQQRHPEAGRRGLGQHRLAAALHAQQQHALGRVQSGRALAPQEDRPALVDPALEPVGPGHVGKAGGVVFVMQVPGAVEQLELEPGQLRQVVLAERAVGEDQLARDPACVDHAQPAQVVQDLLDRLVVHLDPTPAVLAGIGFGLLAQHLQQRVEVGQARIEAGGQCLQLGRQLHLGPDQHQHMGLAMTALDQVAQGTLVAGIAQVGVEIEQQVDPTLFGLADHLQRRTGIGRADRVILAVHVDAAQALGDRPAVQGTPDVHQGLPEQLHDTTLVLGLDDDQRGVGADQCAQVL
ncbi:hypothetical protein D3C71_1010350 [compost metagenome]